MPAAVLDLHLAAKGENLVFNDYVSAGLWGTINICLPAIIAMAGWQLFVRFTLQGASTAVGEPIEDKD